MTQTEKLALRLSQFPGRLVSVLAFVDPSGALVFWVIDEDKKVEGTNGKALNPPPQYNCELEHESKERD